MRRRKTLRAQLEARDARLVAVTAELARAQAERDTALPAAQVTAAERDGTRAQAKEALRAEHVEQEAACERRSSGPPRGLRACKSALCCRPRKPATRSAAATVAKVRQRNEQLVSDVQRLTAEAAEQRRLAERHEKQLTRVMEEARELRCERDALAQQWRSCKVSSRCTPSRHWRARRGAPVKQPDGVQPGMLSE
jgi:hypothetical protein